MRHLRPAIPSSTTQSRKLLWRPLQYLAALHLQNSADDSCLILFGGFALQITTVPVSSCFNAHNAPGMDPSWLCCGLPRKNGVTIYKLYWHLKVMCVIRWWHTCSSGSRSMNWFHLRLMNCRISRERFTKNIWSRLRFEHCICMHIYI